MAFAPRVLVVEDDRDFAESLVIALGTRRCEVEVAPTGEDALRLFSKSHYDITFMDIKLPGKNGVQCLNEIMELAPGAQVVMMTGYSEPSLLDQARRAGAMDILRKPFRMRELLSYIDRLQGNSSDSPVVH